MTEPNDDLAGLIAQTKAGDRKAAEALVLSIQDGIFRLSLRMLGLRAEAQDATQEILLQVLTHLSAFRGESSFRTWVWRIASRHLLRTRRGKREEIASFETIEMLIAKGDESPPMPNVAAAELGLLAEEVRLSCTQGMVLSLERDQRVSWILAEVFELSSEEAAEVLEIEPSAHRKRLSRAREKLAAWMSTHCGLARESNPCRCTRQVPVAMQFGVVDPRDLQYVKRGAPRRDPPLVKEADAIEASARVLKGHPAYAAPAAILAEVRALLDSGRYRMFDA